MELERLRQIMLQKIGVTEELPFGPDALVFKVVGKIFAIIAWQKDPLQVSLKCDPDFAMALRAMYETVKPGYHLNKEHWNTITLDGSIPGAEIDNLIGHSYDIVVKGLKKTDREKLLAESKK